MSERDKRRYEARGCRVEGECRLDELDSPHLRISGAKEQEMKLEIIGSGIRHAELELTDCELKDLAYCIQAICAQSFSGSAVYGCTELRVIANEVKQ